MVTKHATYVVQPFYVYVQVKSYVYSSFSRLYIYIFLFLEEKGTFIFNMLGIMVWTDTSVELEGRRAVLSVVSTYISAV